MVNVVYDATKEMGRISNIYEKAIKRGLRKGLIILLEELKKNTPEDTKEMLNSYRMKGVSKQGDSYVGEITNDADHAIYVEFGVKGKIYSYQKPKGNKGWYKGIGAKTFRRSLDNKKQEILSIIKNEIGSAT